MGPLARARPGVQILQILFVIFGPSWTLALVGHAYVGQSRALSRMISGEKAKENAKESGRESVREFAREKASGFSTENTRELPGGSPGSSLELLGAPGRCRELWGES